MVPLHKITENYTYMLMSVIILTLQKTANNFCIVSRFQSTHKIVLSIDITDASIKQVIIEDGMLSLHV